ncbi:hypothetical protein BC830DRAFT_1170076 [Chytriomyces sp. MP71]|nr:hypothetical protein BC830DRAFT_1170076 [Chytriomyces sp. MP71]
MLKNKPTSSYPHSRAASSLRPDSASRASLHQQSVKAGSAKHDTSEFVLAASIVSPSSHHTVNHGSKAQPRLLQELWAKVRHELTLLESHPDMNFGHDHHSQDTLADNDSESRLQIYAEVFERFMTEFKTYEPLLSEIKSTYDTHIAAQHHRIAQLEPYRTKVEIFKYEAAQDLERVRLEYQERTSQLLTQNSHLERDKAALELEIVNRKSYAQSLAQELREKEMASSDEENLKKRVAALMEQLDLAEVTLAEELAVKEGEIERKNKIFQQKVGECRTLALDNQNLRAELEGCVSKAATHKLMTEISLLKDEVKELTNNLSLMKAEYEKCAYNLNLKTNIIKKMEQQNTTFPDWELVIYSCPGQINEWVNACKGQNCNESIITLMRLLMDMKAHKRQAGRQESQYQEASPGMEETQAETPQREDLHDNKYFTGLGVGTNVPKYLRFKGKVINRMLSQMDLVSLIGDIWVAKIVHDANAKREKDLEDFLFSFLKKRFGSQNIVAEWGYNLYHASKKYYSQNTDCQLFFDVLEGNIDEDVYHARQEVIEQLKNAFYKLDMSLNGKNQGCVRKSECNKLFKEYWPEKTELQVQQLKNALDADQAGDNIMYTWLFSPESNSLFLDVVKEQEEELRARYITDLTNALSTFASNNTKVSAQDWMRALVACDPGKPRDILEEFLARGFGQVVDAIKSRSTIEVDAFVANLQRGVLWKGRDRYAVHAVEIK